MSAHTNASLPSCSAGTISLLKEKHQGSGVCGQAEATVKKRGRAGDEPPTTEPTARGVLPPAAFKALLLLLKQSVREMLKQK